MSQHHFATAIVRIEANNLKDSQVLPVRFECSSVSTVPRHTPIEVLVAGIDELARLLAIEGFDQAAAEAAVHLAYTRVREWRRDQKAIPR